MSIEANAIRRHLMQEASDEIDSLEDQDKDSSAWRKYRHELRELPNQKGWPNKIKWPAKP